MYPIAYLKAWLKHKNLENLLVQGASHLVAEMIEADATKEKKSLDGLQLVNFKEVRPSKMLGLEKNQVKSLVEERWSVEALKIFHFLKEDNYPTSHEFHQECVQLGYRQCQDMAMEFPEVFPTIVLYLKKQRKKDSRNDFAMLKDYWNMAEPLGLDLENPDVQFPSRLHSAHDRVMKLYKQESVRINEEKMAECFRKRECFSWENENILIRPVKSSDELKEEGRLLRHCVYSYSKKVEQGQTSIFFIRSKKEPNKPWFTLEFDVESKKLKAEKEMLELQTSSAEKRAEELEADLSLLQDSFLETEEQLNQLKNSPVEVAAETVIDQEAIEEAKREARAEMEHDLEEKIMEIQAIKESHAKNKKDTSVQAETIPFPEELIESIVLSAMGQGDTREEQTLVALHELGEKLGFCGEDEETMILFEQSEQTIEEKRAYIEKVRKANKQWGKQ